MENSDSDGRDLDSNSDSNDNSHNSCYWQREREIANRDVDDGYNSKHRLTLFNKFTIILIFMVIIHLNVEDNFDFNT
jgi:hypothetical protein